MTSNAGSAFLKKQNTIGFGLEKEGKDDYDKMSQTIHEELKKFFRPEFLNRVDEIIVFNKLGEGEVKAIVARLLDELKDRLDKVDTKVDFDPSVISLVSKKGYDPEYGARPLERSIRKLIEEPLTDEILENMEGTDRAYRLTVEDDEIKIIKDEHEEEKESLQV